MADRSSAPDLQIDVHTLPLGKKKGDDSFVEGHLMEQIAKKGGDAGAVTAATPAAAKLGLDQEKDELFFYPAGKKPGKKDVGAEVNLLTLTLTPGSAAALTDEVKKAIAGGTN